MNVYIISSYCREGFSHPFNFFVVSEGQSFMSSFKTARKKIFVSMEHLPTDSYILLCKQKHSISINQ